MPFSFFRRKKPLEAGELDESIESVLKEIDHIDDWEDPRRIQHYILDACEEIIKTTKELEVRKSRYHILTSYLQDIAAINSLPEKQSKELLEVAGNIHDLEKEREKYLGDTKKLSDEQFALLAAREDVIPPTILKLQENEAVQAKIKRDMQALEAQKNEYEIERDSMKNRRQMLTRISILLFVALASVFVLFVVLSVALDMDVTWFSLTIFAIAVLYVCFLFYERQSTKRRSREVVRSLNKTISMLNVVRMKYATATASVAGDCDRFGVHSSYELNYQWEIYLDESSKKRKFERDNNDFEYFYGRLHRILDSMELNDPPTWYARIPMLADRAKLQEMNRRLLGDRTKVRGEIEALTIRVRSERDEINRLMREHEYYEPEILEILATVDKRCGLNPAR